MEEKKKKILIAEDEKAIAHALELKLTHAGYEAKAVSNGEEALAELEQDKPDVLLLDLMMPKKDGFGVLEEMQKKGMQVPTIVLSNLSQEEDVARAKALGAKDFFIKSNTPIANIVTEVGKLLT